MSRRGEHYSGRHFLLYFGRCWWPIPSRQPLFETSGYRAKPFRDSIAEGDIARVFLIFIGYRASIAEIPLCGGGIAPPLRMLSKEETLRKGGGGIAPNWPCPKMGKEGIGVIQPGEGATKGGGFLQQMVKTKEPTSANDFFALWPLFLLWAMRSSLLKQGVAGCPLSRKRLWIFSSNLHGNFALKNGGNFW